MSTYIKKLDWTDPYTKQTLGGMEIERHCVDFPEFELSWRTKYWLALDELGMVVIRSEVTFTIWQPHFMKSFVTEAELRRYLRSILDKKK